MADRNLTLDDSSDLTATHNTSSWPSEGRLVDRNLLFIWCRTFYMVADSTNTELFSLSSEGRMDCWKSCIRPFQLLPPTFALLTSIRRKDATVEILYKTFSMEHVQWASTTGINSSTVNWCWKSSIISTNLAGSRLRDNSHILVQNSHWLMRYSSNGRNRRC